MSHFTVLVISDDAKMETIKRLLQPYHEYECTGVKDEFVVFIDHHDDLMKEWETKKVDRIRAPDGTLYYGFEEDVFYRMPTAEELVVLDLPEGQLYKDFPRESGEIEVGDQKLRYATHHVAGKGRVTHIRYIPEGYEEVQVPISEAYESLEEYASDWHGWESNEEGRYGDLTNPNKKWDWWEIGGRWSGMLLGKGGVGLKGEPGLMGSQYSASGVDQVRMDQLDLDRMRAIANERRHNAVVSVLDAIKRHAAWTFVKAKLEADSDRDNNILDLLDTAKEDYRIVEKQDPDRYLRGQGVLQSLVTEFFEGFEAPSDENIIARWQEFGPRYVKLSDEWDVLLKAFDEALEAGQRDIKLPRFWDWMPEQDPVVKELIADKIHHLGDTWDGAGIPWTEADPFAWAEKAPALGTYAICDSEGWHERGQMGLFGISTGDMSEADWEAAYKARLERIRPDQYLTVIDCHI